MGLQRQQLNSRRGSRYIQRRKLDQDQEIYREKNRCNTNYCQTTCLQLKNVKISVYCHKMSETHLDLAQAVQLEGQNIA